MVETANIEPHMEVVGSDGDHLGRVDHVRGAEIELARYDLDARGKHHTIPLSWVEWVDDKVHLSLTQDDAKARWTQSD